MVSEEGDSAGSSLMPAGLGRQQEAQAWAVSQIHHNLSWGQRGCGEPTSPSAHKEVQTTFLKGTLGFHMGELCHFSRDTSKNQPVGGEKRGINLGMPRDPPTYASCPPVGSPIQETGNSEGLDITSYASGTL